MIIMRWEGRPVSAGCRAWRGGAERGREGLAVSKRRAQLQTETKIWKSDKMASEKGRSFRILSIVTLVQTTHRSTALLCSRCLKMHSLCLMREPRCSKVAAAPTRWQSLWPTSSFCRTKKTLSSYAARGWWSTRRSARLLEILLLRYENLDCNTPPQGFEFPLSIRVRGFELLWY